MNITAVRRCSILGDFERHLGVYTIVYDSIVPNVGNEIPYIHGLNIINRSGGFRHSFPCCVFPSVVGFATELNDFVNGHTRTPFTLL